MKKNILFIIIVLAIASCGKYEEGPIFSLRSKKNRLCREWRLDKGYLNGEESEIDINEINPNGKAFIKCKLKKYSPKTRKIANLVFDGAELIPNPWVTYELSPGEYRLKIDVFRKRKNKRIQIDVLERTLVVSGGHNTTLQWKNA